MTRLRDKEWWQKTGSKKSILLTPRMLRSYIGSGGKIGSRKSVCILTRRITRLQDREWWRKIESKKLAIYLLAYYATSIQVGSGGEKLGSGA